jgi:hypothetical protein
MACAIRVAQLVHALVGKRKRRRSVVGANDENWRRARAAWQLYPSAGKIGYAVVGGGISLARAPWYGMENSYVYRYQYFILHYLRNARGG